MDRQSFLEPKILKIKECMLNKKDEQDHRPLEQSQQVNHSDYHADKKNRTSIQPTL